VEEILYNDALRRMNQKRNSMVEQIKAPSPRQVASTKSEMYLRQQFAKDFAQGVLTALNQVEAHVSHVDLKETEDILAALHFIDPTCTEDKVDMLRLWDEIADSKNYIELDYLRECLMSVMHF